MRTFETEMPIDCLVSSSQGLAAGGYSLADGKRTGKIYFYGEDMRIKGEVETSGTLDMKVGNEVLYAANSRDVCMVALCDGGTATVQTDCINTYVSLADGSVVVSGLDGVVRVFDESLRSMDSIRIGDSPVWVSEVFGGELVSGSEDGSMCFVDVRSGRRHGEMQRGSGITSLHMENDCLYVGSYDEHIEVVDRRNLCVIRKVHVGGGVWRILRIGERFYVACVYEGMKVLNASLDVVEEHKTESIVYALAAARFRMEETDAVLFASFYDRKVHMVSSRMDQ